MNSLETMKHVTEKMVNNMSHMVMTSTGDVDSVMNNFNDSMTSWAPVIATAGFIVIGIVLVAPVPEQIKGWARTNIVWIILGILIISVAPSLVQDLF